MTQRVGALCGLAFVGLLVWSFSIHAGFEASPENSDLVIMAEMSDVGDDAGTATVIAMFSIPFLLAFGGFVRDRFARSGVPGWLGAVFLSGSVLLAVALMLIMAMGQMASTVGGIAGGEAIARLVIVYGWNSSTLFVPALFAIGASALFATIEAGALPRPVGYGAALVAVSALAPWVGFLVLLAWIAVTSLVLAREPADELVTV